MRFQDIPNAQGHVGYEFLRGFAVTLDSKNGRIQLLQQSPADKKKGTGVIPGDR